MRNAKVSALTTNIAIKLFHKTSVFRPRDKSNEMVRCRKMIQNSNFCCNCMCGMEKDSDATKSMVAVKTLKG